MVTSIVGCMGIIIVCILCDFELHYIILKTLFSVVLSIIIYGAILLLLKNKVAFNILERAKNILQKEN